MEKNNGLSLNIQKELATGKYANLAVITHSKNEIILDFAAVLPALPQAEVVSRVIMTPEHAKRLLLALQDNIGKFESNYGTIELGETVTGIPFMGGNGAKS